MKALFITVKDLKAKSQIERKGQIKDAETLGRWEW